VPRPPDRRARSAGLAGRQVRTSSAAGTGKRKWQSCSRSVEPFCAAPAVPAGPDRASRGRWCSTGVRCACEGDVAFYTAGADLVHRACGWLWRCPCRWTPLPIGCRIIARLGAKGRGLRIGGRARFGGLAGVGAFFVSFSRRPPAEWENGLCMEIDLAGTWVAEVREAFERYGGTRGQQNDVAGAEGICTADDPRTRATGWGEETCNGYSQIKGVRAAPLAGGPASHTSPRRSSPRTGAPTLPVASRVPARRRQDRAADGRPGYAVRRAGARGRRRT